MITFAILALTFLPTSAFAVEPIDLVSLCA